MRMVDIIEKKRDGMELNEEEIKFFINGYTKNQIPDYQASALLMAIVFNKMSEKETALLTHYMEYSGNRIDLSSIEGIKVDKHSTGGVGDKTSLALGPLVATCGAKLAKMSGRGLGHTGGTLDKMESVPGTRISLSEKEFIDEVNKIGIAIIGQTQDIVPADKKLYALRDVTGTVESIPLIASSIMSKKLASGADTILLDVKFGKGAFMKTLQDARILAHEMVKIGKNLNRDTRAIITDMNEPLGKAVGNSIEVKEAIATLKGHGPKDFVELILNAGGIMLEQAKIVSNYEQGIKLIQKAIDDGSGFNKMKEFFAYQGGDISYLDNPDKFNKAKYKIDLKSPFEGYISQIDSLCIGVSAMKLGAGREFKEDVIDMSAGIYLHKKVGDYVTKNEDLLTIYTNKSNYQDVINPLLNSYVLSDKKIKINPIIYDYIK